MLKFIVGAVLALLFWKWVLVGLVAYGIFKYLSRPRYVVVKTRRF